MTGYNILIRNSNNVTYSNPYCIQTSTSCTVAVSVLLDYPFSLTWGQSVYAVVIAANKYGNSAQSLPGNGAVLVTSPDAPLNLKENTSYRSLTSLGINWS